MDRKVFGGVDGATLIDGLTNNVDNAAKSLRTDRHLNGRVGVQNGLATHETLSGVESNGADVIATQVLGDLEHEARVGLLHLKGIENGGKGALELHIDDGTNNLRNLSGSRGKAA